MTQADILVKYSRRRLADMIIELQHQVTTLEEQSFDYASRAMRAESALARKLTAFPTALQLTTAQLPYVLTTNPPKS
jgi:hypothetical protein